MNEIEIKQYLEEQDIEILRSKLLGLLEDNENLRTHITFFK